MRLTLNLAVAPLLIGLAWAPIALAQDGHAHHAPAAAVSQEIPAQRYATDAPLRTGMAQIRAAVGGLAHYEMGHMGPEQAATLATDIQEQIGYIVANCKLDPQADAALHVVIAKLGGSAQALKGSPEDLSAIPPMREALQDYARQFDDPGLEAADEPEESN